MRLYRGMRANLDGLPATEGNPKSALSVRAGNGEYDDIPVRDGHVEPGTGGMSVTHDDPQKLPAHRVPPSHGGSAKGSFIFYIDAINLGLSLTSKPYPRKNDDSHYCIEPAARCLVEKYKDDLAETRTHWSKL